MNSESKKLFEKIFSLANGEDKSDPIVTVVNNTKNENLYIGRDIVVTSPKQSLLAVEPFTLSWVALMVAEGILSGAGTKVFTDLFNRGADLASIQEEMLENIGQILRSAIQEDRIRYCRARMEACTTLIRQYNRAPNSSINRLDTAYTESVFLASECKSLGFRAALPYANAISMQISILQEKIKLGGHEEERLNIGDIANDGYDYMFDTALPEFAAWNRSRFGSVSYRQGNWLYTFDGRTQYPPRLITKPEAEKRREEHINREAKSTSERLHGTAWEVAKGWGLAIATS